MLFFVTIKADLDFFFFLELFSGEKKDFILYLTFSLHVFLSHLSLCLSTFLSLCPSLFPLSHTLLESYSLKLSQIGLEQKTLSLFLSLLHSLTHSHTHTTWEYQDGRELGSTHSHSRSLGVEQTTFATDSDDWKCLTPHNWMKGRISGSKCSWNAKSII